MFIDVLTEVLETKLDFDSRTIDKIINYILWSNKINTDDAPIENILRMNTEYTKKYLKIMPCHTHIKDYLEDLLFKKEYLALTPFNTYLFDILELDEELNIEFMIKLMKYAYGRLIEYPHGRGISRINKLHDNNKEEIKELVRIIIGNLETPYKQWLSILLVCYVLRMRLNSLSIVEISDKIKQDYNDKYKINLLVTILESELINLKTKSIKNFTEINNMVDNIIKYNPLDTKLHTVIDTTMNKYLNKEYNNLLGHNSIDDLRTVMSTLEVASHLTIDNYDLEIYKNTRIKDIITRVKDLFEHEGIEVEFKERCTTYNRLHLFYVISDCIKNKDFINNTLKIDIDKAMNNAMELELAEEDLDLDKILYLSYINSSKLKLKSIIDNFLNSISPYIYITVDDGKYTPATTISVLSKVLAENDYFIPTGYTDSDYRIMKENMELFAHRIYTTIVRRKKYYPIYFHLEKFSTKTYHHEIGYNKRHCLSKPTAEDCLLLSAINIIVNNPIEDIFGNFLYEESSYNEALVDDDGICPIKKMKAALYLFKSKYSNSLNEETRNYVNSYLTDSKKNDSYIEGQ